MKKRRPWIYTEYSAVAFTPYQVRVARLTLSLNDKKNISQSCVNRELVTMRGLMIASVLSAVISVALAAPQKADNGDLDSLIASVFTTSSPQNAAPNSNCECVPYYQCQNGTISTTGIGVIDIRAGGACTNYLDVCCNPPDMVKPEDQPTPVPKVQRGCGHRNPDGVGFRITGQNNSEAQFGEFPWMVAILAKQVIGTNSGTVLVYQCGGALIHPRAVLTAAHCVNGRKGQPSELKIRAGEWDTQTTSELYPYQDREVESVRVHENFNSGSLFNDVGILILKTAVDLAENVELVCLPPPNANFDGSRCFASGWGKDVFGKEGQYQVILKRVELPIVPHGDCQTALRTTRVGKYFILDPSFTCAGGEPGKDTCKGDGGSPLVCPLKNDPTRYVQVGIVAWGIGCGGQVPGVYANVAALREWIDEKMISNNLDSTVYQA